MRDGDRPDRIEDAIRDALERGELRGLPGEGRPLPDDGLPTDEKWAATHILRGAGAVPEWAELRRQIDAETARVFRRARAHLDWLAGRASALASTPADRIMETTRATTERDRRVRAQIASDLEELNRLIRRYDLLVPPALQVAEVGAEGVFGRSV